MRWDPKSGEPPEYLCSFFGIGDFIDSTVLPFFTDLVSSGSAAPAVDAASAGIDFGSQAASAGIDTAALAAPANFGGLTSGGLPGGFGTPSLSIPGSNLVDMSGAQGGQSWWSQLGKDLVPNLGTAALLSGAGNIGGGIAGAIGAGNAADIQSRATTAASNNALTAGTRAQALLEPFRQLGVGAVPQLQALTGTNPGGNPLTAALTKPFNPSDLANTPGYKFTLDQGLQATENGYAAGGLGRSGAALKGAAEYATGLADKTYNTQLQNYLTQNRQIYDMLSGQISTGENAAAGAGNLGVGAQTASNNLLTSGAAAQASGIIGGTNALTGAGNSIGQNAILMNILAQNQQNQNLTSRGNPNA